MGPCPSCSEPLTSAATYCPACGAALAPHGPALRAEAPDVDGGSDPTPLEAVRDMVLLVVGIPVLVVLLLGGVYLVFGAQAAVWAAVALIGWCVWSGL